MEENTCRYAFSEAYYFGFSGKLMRKSRNIFSNHIEFQVDQAAGLDGLHIGMSERIGYDGHVKAGSFYIEDGEADAVEADGAFFDDEAGEFFREFETEFPAAVQVFSFGADRGGVDVSLYDVTVEAAVHDQASFQIDQVVPLPAFQVGLLEGFLDGRDPVGAVLYLFHGETDPVVRDALIYFQLSGYGGFDPEGTISAPGCCFPDFSERFDNTCKHGGEFRNFLHRISIFRILLYICSPVAEWQLKKRSKYADYRFQRLRKH